MVGAGGTGFPSGFWIDRSETRVSRGSAGGPGRDARAGLATTPRKEILVKPSALVLALLLAPVLGLGAAGPASAERLANYFVCTLKEGKSPQDLLAFKASYEEAVAAAGLEGYELRVHFPIYWVTTWFRQSEWPGKFRTLMTCADSSLWRVMD